jgi:glycosyltransferase involved in cell wall biosynthesis
MKILHFTLGLPPYRSGGLTKYSTDLMMYQADCGKEVSVLYSAYSNIFSFYKKPFFVKKETFNKIKVFEIKNSPPIPLHYGVKSPNDILKIELISETDIDNFYKVTRPDILHIHTLMGLPQKLVKLFKSKGVKIIFSTHDYYGLCLKCNFIDYLGYVCNVQIPSKCYKCNYYAPKTNYLRLRNFKLFLKFKRELGSLVYNYFNYKLGKLSVPPEKILHVIPYKNIIEYYNNFILLYDQIHYNSLVTKEVYSPFIRSENTAVIPVSHRGIKDKRTRKYIDKSKLKLGFIGHLLDFKGFPLLKKVLIELYSRGIKNWEMNVWGSHKIGIDNDCDKIIYSGKFHSNDLTRVYNSMDVLIVPSLCKETFSLITLEAISFGLPVLVSENVGAKDIVKYYNDEFIFNPDFNSLINKLLKLLLNPILINKFNEKILEKEFDFHFNDHAQIIDDLYLKLISKS